MKYSAADLPPASRLRQKAIVESRDGKTCLLILGNGMLNLYWKTSGNNGASTEEWQHDRIITLPQLDGPWSILGADESFLLLRVTSRDSLLRNMSSDEMPGTQIFTLDLKTSLVERLCESNKHIGSSFLYSSFPPPLSLPTI
ncbi:hypothetical protein ACP4OV_022944 [Aristida adscensionis]